MGALPEELRHFADTLDVRQFRALSPGLGLGEVRPARGGGSGASEAGAPRLHAQSYSAALKASAEYDLESHMPPVPQAPPVNRGDGAPSANPVYKSRKVRDGRPGLGTSLGSRCLRRIGAWGVDLLMVALTLTVALALAGLGQALQMGVAKDSGHWIDLAVFKWVRDRQVWEMLAILYGLFLAYGLTFRVAVGRTLGQSMTGLPMGKKRRA